MKYFIILSIYIILLGNSLSSKKESTRTSVNKYFNIVGKTGYCVAAEKKHSLLIQRPCGLSDDLLWQKISVGGGNYIFRSKNGQVMDNADNRVENRNPVIAWTRHGGKNQQWNLEKVNSKFLLKNVQSQKCFDDTGLAANGRSYHIWNCSKTNKNQLFELREIPVNYGNLIGNTGFCVSSRNYNGRLVQQVCGTTSDLLWKKVKIGNNYLFVAQNKLVLDNSGSKTNNGNPVLGYKRHNGLNQQWQIINFKFGKILLRNAQSNKCLDDTGNPRIGGFYHIWSCFIYNQNQWFEYKKIR